VRFEPVRATGVNQKMPSLPLVHLSGYSHNCTQTTHQYRVHRMQRAGSTYRSLSVGNSFFLQLANILCIVNNRLLMFKTGDHPVPKEENGGSGRNDQFLINSLRPSRELGGSAHRIPRPRHKYAHCCNNEGGREA